jgi:hypothetical protein
MSEMQCAGVRPYDLQSTMCAMSEMQCVPSSRKTYPCQKNSRSKNEIFIIQWLFNVPPDLTLRLLSHRDVLAINISLR